MYSTLLYIVGAYLLILLVIYFTQDRWIFKPEKLHPDFQYAYDVPFRELFFDAEPGVRINGLHFYVKDPLGLVLYLHGNSRSIKGWAKYAKDFSRYQYDVVLVDYRGFGKSTGKRGEKAMFRDMQFVYGELAKTYGENHIIVYGRSLGSGFAAKLASEHTPRYLILDAPFYSFRGAVQRLLPLLPVRLVLRYRLPTYKWLTLVKCHTYLIHGTRDLLIPIRQSERLRDLNPDKITLIPIEGGKHNNLPTFPQYHNFLKDILAP
ncbi:MAG: alpha/beta fold hydrolase [Bacteroidota bacterium]|nr:alpha/beta fold hydrolase [Bacteroidota bacterium]